MERMIAFCGIVCTECPAFIATQNDDQEALKQVAAQWSQELNAPDITVESVICDGCLTDEGRKCAHCFECEVRACGMGRGVVNCAHCDEYICEKLEGFFAFAPDAKASLEGIRQSL